MHEKYSPLMFVCFLATQQFYEIRKRVLIQIHAPGRRVIKSDMQTAFSETCFASIYLDQKIIRRCNLLVKL